MGSNANSDAVAQPPMKHAVIACHPAVDSFTLAVADRYARTVKHHGHEVVLRDLYRCGFDPVLKEPERHGSPEADVAEEWELLGRPDVFVLVYPIWYGAPPAMLKGYVERVLGSGRQAGRPLSEESDDRVRGRRLVSLTSSGHCRAWLDEKGVPGALKTIYDHYQADVLGFKESHRFHFDGLIEGISAHELQKHLSSVETAAKEVISRLSNGPPDIDPYRYLRESRPAW